MLHYPLVFKLILAQKVKHIRVAKMVQMVQGEGVQVQGPEEDRSWGSRGDPPPITLSKMGWAADYGNVQAKGQLYYLCLHRVCLHRVAVRCQSIHYISLDENLSSSSFFS